MSLDVKLTPGLFFESNTLGLSSPHFCMDEVVHNGEWFNGRGEYVGHGDLDYTDLDRLQKNLSEGEIFIAINEDHEHKFGAVALLQSLIYEALYVVVRGHAYEVTDSPMGRRDRPDWVELLSHDGFIALLSE